MKKTKRNTYWEISRGVTAMAVITSMVFGLSGTAYATGESEVSQSESSIKGEAITDNEIFIALDEEGNIELIPIEHVETPDYEELEELDQAEYLVVSEVDGEEEIVEVMDTLEEAEQFIEEVKIAEEEAEKQEKNDEEALVNLFSMTVMATNDKLTADNLKASKSYSSTAANSIVVFISSNDVVKYKNAETGAEGYIAASYGPDAAYLGMQDGQVKFKQSGVIGLVDADKVNVVSYEDYAASGLITSVYTTSQGKLYHKITTNLTGHASTNMVGYQQDYMESGATYYSYDGHYFYKSYSAMVTDYQAGTYKNSINASSPYYNYFQYLSHRAKTNYTVEEIDAYITYRTSKYSNSKMANTGAAFVETQNTYGANAILSMGVAMNESAYGTSSIASSKNNLFGHGAVDSNPYYGATGYATVADGIKYHAEYFVSKGYANPKDSRYFGAHLGDKQSGMNVKYASDPYWGEKAATHGYYMEEYAKTTDSIKNSDYGKCSMGLADGILTVYNEPNGKIKFYTTQNASGAKPLDVGVVVLDKTTVDGVVWYKIQSDAAIKSDRSGSETSKWSYDYDVSYGYVKASAIELLTGSPQEEEKEEITYEKGDVNGDGKILASDYMVIKNHILERTILTGDALERADVNKDGKIMASDYMLIKNYILGRGTLD